VPITPDEAADIAKRHGLGLQDAAGLLTLATDAKDADRIAARFAEAEKADPIAEAGREYAAALFGRKPDAAPDPEPEPTPNVVPSEGTNPAHVDRTRDLRRYVARIFDTPDQDHI
jgi:hypothetical protein